MTIKILCLNYAFNGLVLHLNNGYNFDPQLVACNFLLGGNSLMSCPGVSLSDLQLIVAYRLQSAEGGRFDWIGSVCLSVCCQIQNEVILLQ